MHFVRHKYRRADSITHSTIHDLPTEYFLLTELPPVRIFQFPALPTFIYQLYLTLRMFIHQLQLYHPLPLPNIHPPVFGQVRIFERFILWILVKMNIPNIPTDYPPLPGLFTNYSLPTDYPPDIKIPTKWVIVPQSAALPFKTFFPPKAQGLGRRGSFSKMTSFI